MRISILLAVAIALGLSARAARADVSLKPAAQVRFDAGVRLTSAGKYRDAIGEFQAAYEIDPNPVLFYSLAVAERLAGRCPAAVYHYRRFLRSKPSQQRIEAARAGITLCGDVGPVEELAWYDRPAPSAIAGGVIVLAVGAGFLIAAESTRDRAAAAQFSDDFEATLDRATGLRRTGVVLAVLGAALVGGGAAYELAVHRRRRPAIAIGIAGRSIFVARSF